MYAPAPITGGTNAPPEAAAAVKQLTDKLRELKGAGVAGALAQAMKSMTMETLRQVAQAKVCFFIASYRVFRIL